LINLERDEIWLNRWDSQIAWFLIQR
jgi:hypothetical protein